MSDTERRKRIRRVYREKRKTLLTNVISSIESTAEEGRSSFLEGMVELLDEKSCAKSGNDVLSDLRMKRNTLVDEINSIISSLNDPDSKGTSWKSPTSNENNITLIPEQLSDVTPAEEAGDDSDGENQVVQIQSNFCVFFLF